MLVRLSKFIVLSACVLTLAMPALAALSPEQLKQLAAEGDWAAALGGYLAVLEKNPQDVDARKNAWRAAMRLGLFDQAASLGATLDAREKAAMEGDQIAVEIRRGRIDARTLSGPARYRQLDAALAGTESLSAAFLVGATLDGEQRRRLIDRIAALVARDRPRDAVALYESLRAAGIEVPNWGLSDVAGAYLSLRRPKEAEALYRKVLAASPDDFDANLGLFYALVESEQLDLAQAHIDHFAAQLPARRHRDGKPNGERWSAEVASDQVRLYADQIDQAQDRIAQRLAETPFNSEARSAEASLHLARGWPRQGEADLRRNLGSDPRNPGLHADRAEVLLSLQQWEQARETLDQAKALDPQHPRVRQAGETFALHDRRELYTEAGYGRGDTASPFGSTDWHLDSWLYSSPISERWRVFVHNYSASADFNGDRTHWVRTGVGAEWRAGNWRVTGETNGGEGENVGFLATARWQPNDYWKVYASADSLTNDIPLQAVRAGVSAQRASVGVDLRLNESRKFGVSANVADFSDSNLRHALTASWLERWYSGPRWIFETTLGADASHNSLGYAAAYFNPPKDHSWWVAGAVEHLVWRNYDRSFRQRLVLTTGSYWQSGFGSDSTDAIEYQHRWELDRDLSLRYGIGRSLRPYDGVREARNFGTLTLLWRF